MCESRWTACPCPICCEECRAEQEVAVVKQEGQGRAMSELRIRIADEISNIQVGSGYESTTIGITAALEAADALIAAGVVTEEPEGPTTMKPFHREYPGSPRLFHTYCSEHPDFGTCEEEVQAHRDIADHLASEHYDVNQE